MIIKPRVKDYLCLTAHPEGCKKNVADQIAYVKAQGEIPGDAKKVLVIGCSTGYGLASRIVAAFGCHADTLGIMFERPSNGRKTASPGWYNTASFEQFANEEGVYAKTINGDAFSKEIKDLTIETIKKDLGKIDLVVYSLAAPRRTTPDGVTYRSVLKTTGEEFTNKNLNLKDNSIGMKSIPAATEEEVEATVKVMGGEDWKLWMQALKDADVFVGLSDANVITGDDIKVMNDKPIVFALANPVPEIDPKLAKDSGAYIIGTGSGKYPNQVNNVLAFPGLFKGLLQRRDIKHVSSDLKIQIAKGIANLTTSLDPEHIIVDVFDERVVPTIEKIVLKY